MIEGRFEDVKKLLTMIYGCKCCRISHINHETEVIQVSCTAKFMMPAAWCFARNIVSSDCSNVVAKNYSCPVIWSTVFHKKTLLSVYTL